MTLCLAFLADVSKRSQVLRNWPLLLFLFIIQQNRFFVPGCRGFRFTRERKERAVPWRHITSSFSCTLSPTQKPFSTRKVGGGSPFLVSFRFTASLFLTNDLICVRVASMLVMACYRSSANAFFLFLYPRPALHAIRARACVLMSSQCKGEGRLDLIMRPCSRNLGDSSPSRVLSYRLL